MSAWFVWQEASRKTAPSVGDKRVVSRFLLWPKKLEGEWRWLGFDRIQQEFQRYRIQPPDMRAMDVVGWRDVAWEPPERFREGSHLASIKVHGRNGPPPSPAKPPPPPNPPSPRSQRQFSKEVVRHRSVALGRDS